MKSNTIVILLLFAFNPCNGQNSGKSNEAQNTVNSDISKVRIEANAGIIYFSFDNGNSWKNAGNGIPEKVSIGLGGLAASEKELGIATEEYGVFLYNFSDSIWKSIPTGQQIIEGNIGPLLFYRNDIYVGTQFRGIFSSEDCGKTWASRNSGLGNLTIRRFFEFENKLYACTNDGVYSFNGNANSWTLEFGHNSLQVNGITFFKGSCYIATNQGVYGNEGGWRNVLPDHSVHNISSDSLHLYAMTYNALLLSSIDGINWHSAQEGLPKNLYTFNVMSHLNVVFAGQWDGVYRKTDFDAVWMRSGDGIPENFAATNLISYDGIIVVTSSERKLKSGTIPED